MIGQYSPLPSVLSPQAGTPLNDVSPSMMITPTDSSSLPHNTYWSGYRRAWTGTFPFDVSLAVQQFTASNMPSTSTLPSMESFDDKLQFLPSLSASPLALMRCALRHYLGHLYCRFVCVDSFLPQAFRTLLAIASSLCI